MNLRLFSNRTLSFKIPALLSMLAGLFVFVHCGYAAALPNDPASLDTGFRQMYNLDFPGAHKTFEAWQAMHPEDPLGAASDAAAYLFGEFERLHILQIAMFTDNKRVDDRDRLSPDPAVKAAFETQLTKA